jgi:hypothetical protein
MSLDRVYVYHPPFGTQTERYQTLRAAARAFAEAVKAACPPSREQSLAQTCIQEAVMWANASIAINEIVPTPLPADSPSGNTAVAEPIATTQESI